MKTCPPRRRFFGDRKPVSRTPRPARLSLERLEDRCLLASGFTQVNLASDVPGLARVTDPNLVNPWGLAFSPTGPFWFSENGTGVSDLLDGRGTAIPLVASVPSAGMGGPTGVVFNGGSGFAVSAGGASASSVFLFATQDGTLSGWNGTLDPTHAVVAVDESAAGAVFDGLALATDAAGQRFLYAADFGRGRVEVFDQGFHRVERPGAFTDPAIPTGYAPFNVQNVGNLLVVTYARQGGTGSEDVPGAGHGFVDVYATDGSLLRRFASGGPLNSPWGVALAPAAFGPFGGDLLVGNNGDGHINAYDPATGAFLGQLADGSGALIAVPDLWALTFGNGHLGGDASTLFFAAGLDNWHGLFGALQSPRESGADTGGAGAFNDHAPGERQDYPLPPSGGPALLAGTSDPRVVVSSVLLPMAESSLALVPTLASVTAPAAGPSSSAPAGPTGTAALNPSVAVTLLASGTTLLVPPVSETAAPAPGTLSPSASLNTFLDLNGVVSSTQTRAAVTPPDAGVEASAASRTATTSVPAGVEFLASEPAGDILADVRPPDGTIFAQGIALDSPALFAAGSEDASGRGQGGWAALAAKLLVVVSVPLAWGVTHRRRQRPAPALGKTSDWPRA